MVELVVPGHVMDTEVTGPINPCLHTDLALDQHIRAAFSCKEACWSVGACRQLFGLPLLRAAEEITLRFDDAISCTFCT